jgi:hypothetical protein
MWFSRPEALHNPFRSIRSPIHCMQRVLVDGVLLWACQKNWHILFWWVLVCSFWAGRVFWHFFTAESSISSVSKSFYFRACLLTTTWTEEWYDEMMCEAERWASYPIPRVWDRVREVHLFRTSLIASRNYVQSSTSLPVRIRRQEQHIVERTFCLTDTARILSYEGRIVMRMFITTVKTFTLKDRIEGYIEPWNVKTYT